MRAYITGASGFIGNHLLQRLIQKNWQVRALFHKRNISLAEKCEIVKGDIQDFDLLKDSLQETDVLFHLAAALGSLLIKKEEFFRINALGTKNVLNAAREAGVKRIIHLSSAGVLGSVRKNELADENYPLNPKNIYDETKLDGENIALRFAEKGMDIVVVRPGWIYGPEDRRTFKLIRAIAKKRFILVSKGKTWQTPVYIDDVIQGVLLCLEKGIKGEIYHLAGEEVLTVKEIVETIATTLGEKIPRIRLPLFPTKVAAWKLEKTFLLFKKEAPLTRGKLAFFIHPKPLSIQKAKRELGYAPQTDFETGINQTIAWHKENKWL